MTATAEPETAQPMTGEVVPFTPPRQVEEYRPRIVMAPEDAKALDDQLRECMKAILREGVDYGSIPGAGDKKNLLKPGAEKLLQWFGFGHRSIEIKIERDDPEYPSGVADRARRIGVTYCTEVIKTIPGHGEIIVAACEGYAGYDEDRYYKSAEEARAAAERKERHFAEIDQRQPNPRKWQFVTEDYRAPWNTLVKMAQKRSLVGAAIDATAAAGLFTQDMEDMPGQVASAPSGTATGESIAKVGREAIGALPKESRKALDAWCREHGWPRTADWDTTQWCTALIQVGRIDGQNPASEAAEDPWTVHPEPGTPLEGTVVTPPAAQQNDLLGQWGEAIDAITSPADGERLKADLDRQHKGAVIDSRRANAIRNAIRMKVDSLPKNGDAA